MVNIAHIATGWARTMGLMDIPEGIQQLSTTRLEICSVCPFAKESTALKIIKGDAVTTDIIRCIQCGCPCTEKSLVENEKCPLEKW